MGRTHFVLGLLWAISMAGSALATDFAKYRSSGAEPGFELDRPDWPSRRSGNPFNVLSAVRPDQQCYFDLDEADAPVAEFLQLVRKYVEGQGATITSGDPLGYQFRTPDRKYTFVARTRAIACGKRAHLATLTCIRENFDAPTMDRVFGSMQCGGAQGRAPATAVVGSRPPATGRSRPLVGLIVSPAGEFNARNVEQAYRIGQESGAQITRFFVRWPDIEKRKGHRDWQGTDYMLKLVRDHGLRLAVSFNTVHTAVRGPIPDDLRFRGWSDPELVERFADFVLAFLARYPDLVDYVEIGNEVNAYFANNPREIDAYKDFFNAVHARVKQRHPAVKTGIVFTFHEMQRNNDFSVYERLRAGDFDGFTLYIFNQGFKFERPAREVFDSLQQIARITGTRKFAIDEVGWSAWPSLGGSEASQRAAVEATFDYLEQAPDRLLFLNWYILHDGRDADCNRIAKTFVTPGSAMSRDAKAMTLFSNYLCHLGLRANDGTARAAWDEWVRRTRALGSK